MICIHGPADATATSSYLALLKSRMVYLSAASLPGCHGIKAVKQMCCSSVVYHDSFLKCSVMALLEGPFSL